MKDMKPLGPTRKADLPHGALSQIARRLRPKVSAQHVREVYFGRRTSPRVQRAIENYLARRERQQGRDNSSESAA